MPGRNLRGCMSVVLLALAGACGGDHGLAQAPAALAVGSPGDRVGGRGLSATERAELNVRLADLDRTRGTLSHPSDRVRVDVAAYRSEIERIRARDDLDPRDRMAQMAEVRARVLGRSETRADLGARDRERAAEGRGGEPTDTDLALEREMRARADARAPMVESSSGYRPVLTRDPRVVAVDGLEASEVLP